MNVFRKIIRAYLYLVALVAIISLSVLGAVTIYDLVRNLNNMTVGYGEIITRLKVVVTLSIVIPFVIILVVSSALGFLRLFGVEMTEKKKHKNSTTPKDK